MVIGTPSRDRIQQEEFVGAESYWGSQLHKLVTKSLFKSFALFIKFISIALEFLFIYKFFKIPLEPKTAVKKTRRSFVTITQISFRFEYSHCKKRCIFCLAPSCFAAYLFDFFQILEILIPWFHLTFITVPD